MTRFATIWWTCDGSARTGAQGPIRTRASIEDGIRTRSKRSSSSTTGASSTTEVRVALAREREDLARQVARALRGIDDRVDRLAAALSRGDVVSEELGIGEDDGQEVVEVVRDASGQAPEGFGSLCVGEPALEVLALGLGLLSLGDVERSAREQGSALAVASNALQRQMADLAVRADDAKLGVEGGAHLELAGERVHHALAVVGVHEVARGGALVEDETIHCQDLRELRADADAARRDVELPRPEPSEPRGQPEALVRASLGLFCVGARRDVLDDTRDTHRLACVVVEEPAA